MKKLLIYSVVVLTTLASLAFTPASGSITNCSQYEVACSEFAAEWYASCNTMGGYDCHCRSLRLFNGCMEAHGCDGISDDIMAREGCPVN